MSRPNARPRPGDRGRAEAPRIGGPQASPAAAIQIGHAVGMEGSPESVVRDFLASWSDPDPDRLRSFLADDAVWIDGPNGVHRGEEVIVDELARQLTSARGSWVEVDTLLAEGGTVMVEWHGGFTIRGAAISSKVMAVFEIDPSDRITQWRESYDMSSLVSQIEAAGVRMPE